MKSKKGFISISLVYTMFLLLVALLVYILATYTHNVSVLNVFKEDIITKMESESTPWDDECTIDSNRLNCKVISGKKLEAQIKSKSTLNPLNFALADETSANLYYAVDEKGPVYFYRGKVENNYVEFAGETWRILRVNGDGSIRMVLNKNLTEAQESALKTKLTTNYKDYLKNYNYCSNPIRTNQINDLDYTTIFDCTNRVNSKEDYTGPLELADVIGAGASTYELKRDGLLLRWDYGNNAYFLRTGSGEYYYRLKDSISFVYSRVSEKNEDWGEIITDEDPSSGTDDEATGVVEYKKMVVILKKNVFATGNGAKSNKYKLSLK